MVHAQAYPTKPVRFIVPQATGGASDVLSRIIAQKLTEQWQQQVVVDNRVGAGGNIGTEMTARAAPDGYTWVLGFPGTHAINPALYKNLSWDPVKNFEPTANLAVVPYVVVAGNNVPAKNMKELIALAKAKPGQLNYGSGGTGSGAHFAAEMFKHTTAIDAVHVPYRGIPEALTDLISGRLHFFMSPLASAVSLVRDGKIRAIAVTAKKRVAVYAEVPTLAESGLPGYQWDSWSGLLAPAKTPRPIIERLNREITRVLNQPEIQQRLLSMGAEAAPNTPAAFDKLIAEQVALTIKLAGQAGIKPE